MEDTSREIRNLQQKMWMELSEEERFRRCGDMFELVKASARMNMPQGLSPEEEKRYIFERIYGEPMPVEPLVGEESNV